MAVYAGQGWFEGLARVWLDPGHLAGPGYIMHTRDMAITRETKTDICPLCDRMTAGLAKHLKACEKYQAQIMRASAHADGISEPQDGVDDVDLARLLRALDNGVHIYPTGYRRWLAAGGSPLNSTPKRSLNKTVNEAIRSGLAYLDTEMTAPDVFKYSVKPAPVHLRDAKDPLRPACVGRGIGKPSTFRFRLLDDLLYVDCQACVDAVAK